MVSIDHRLAWSVVIAAGRGDGGRASRTLARTSESTRRRAVAGVTVPAARDFKLPLAAAVAGGP